MGPGNGMGGSTNSGTAISAPTSNPTTGYWAVSGASGWGIWNSADGTQATACGGESSQIQHLAVGDDTTQNTLSLQMNGGGHGQGALLQTEDDKAALDHGRNPEAQGR